MNIQYAALYHVLYRVAVEFGMDPEEVLAREGGAPSIKRQHHARAKFTAYLIAREVTQATQLDIASAYSKDHSTILNGISRARKWLKAANGSYASMVSRLVAEITADLEHAERAFVVELSRRRVVAGPQDFVANDDLPAGTTAADKASSSV